MAVKEYNLDQPMDKLIDLAVKKFGEVDFQDVSVGEVSFKVLQIKHMQKYIDKLMDKSRSGKTIPLPLWAKVWPAGMVVGYAISNYPLGTDCTVLEIGGGSCLPALALASKGNPVTIIDTDWDALLFARINACKNGLEDKVKVVHSDFTQPMKKRFGCIVATELLYDQAEFDRLAVFMDQSLIEEEAAEVFLSLDLKRVAQNFFSECNETFKIMKSTATFKDTDSGEDKPVNLFRLKRK